MTWSLTEKQVLSWLNRLTGGGILWCLLACVMLVMARVWFLARGRDDVRNSFCCVHTHRILRSPCTMWLGNLSLLNLLCRDSNGCEGCHAKELRVHPPPSHFRNKRLNNTKHTVLHKYMTFFLLMTQLNIYVYKYLSVLFSAILKHLGAHFPHTWIAKFLFSKKKLSFYTLVVQTNRVNPLFGACEV